MADRSDTATLATSVYDRLRDDILTGVVAPGAKLKIDALAQRYDAGSAPVREALNRLSAEGWVDRFDQRGFAAARTSLDDLRDLVDLRVELECSALRRAIDRHEPAWEDGLVLALHRLSRLPRSIDPTSYRTNPEWERLHRRFHEALIAGCGSPRLIRLCSELGDQADRYRQIAAATVYPRRHEADEHAAIVEAAIGGDAEEATARLAAHFRTTLTIIETHAASAFDERAAPLR